ncbi:MAG: 5'/3'-nucleotidase SurE [Planctomycetota bacterium]|nr:MAG: 5'/3'-nucleotidase SurE [Planctomycetota bacterium]
MMPIWENRRMYCQWLAPSTIGGVILLVNDDGIEAPGLRALYRCLRRELRQPVLAVAPAEERSGAGHAISINRGLSLTPFHDSDADFFAFSVDGTPSDCCKLGLKVLCTQKPRLVVSGINNGPNVGRSLFYSGTVSAALEAAIEGFPALAVSLDRSEEPDWNSAAERAVSIAKAMLGRNKLAGSVINLNLPVGTAKHWQPLRVVRHGLSGFSEAYSQRHQRDGHPLWHLHGQRIELEEEGETDAHALRAGHPTLSILQPDINGDASLLEALDELSP